MAVSSTVVLYAEDSEDDAYLLQRAFNKANFPGSLVIVPNGLEATRYIAGDGRTENGAVAPLPRVILLDIKMPLLGGLDVLKWIRSREALRDIPVLMLTSSNQDRDVSAAYELGANAYVVKPSSLDRCRELVEDLLAICGPAAAGDHRMRIRGAIPAPARRGTDAVRAE